MQNLKSYKSEQQIQKQILHLLNLQSDFFAWKTQTTGIFDPKTKSFRALSGFSIRGVSDILCVHSPSGRIIAIEVKSEKVKEKGLSVYQVAFLKRIKKSGGLAYCVWSVEQAEQIIKEARKWKSIGLVEK
jgi:hypothetical protein